MDDAAREVIEAAASQTAELGVKLGSMVGAPGMTPWEDTILRANSRRLGDAGRSLANLMAKLT